MNNLALTIPLIVLASFPASAQELNGTSDNLTAHNGVVHALARVPSEGSGAKGTVNDYSPAWASEARHDAIEAGYIPLNIEFAQAGNIFLTATHNGKLYTVVVTPDEKVYASTGITNQEQSHRANKGQ